MFNLRPIAIKKGLDVIKTEKKRFLTIVIDTEIGRQLLCAAFFLNCRSELEKRVWRSRDVREELEWRFYNRNVQGCH